MPHIHTGNGEYDHTVSGFIVRTDGDRPQLLLHRHKILDKWLQFGGHIEVDQSIWTAASHELEDESGYALSQLNVLQPAVEMVDTADYDDVVVHPIPAHINSHAFDETRQHFHTDFSYIFTADQEPAGDVAHGESRAIQAFTEDALRALKDGKDIFRNVKAIGLFALEISQHDDWRRIPATDFAY